jgi:hypothetical protein
VIRFVYEVRDVGVILHVNQLLLRPNVLQLRNRFYHFPIRVLIHNFYIGGDVPRLHHFFVC